MQIAIKQLHPNAKTPSYAHGTDAGMDLYYMGPDVVVDAGARILLNTGIAIAIPRLFAGLIWDKSGIAAKTGLKVMGGVIDSGYRGEVIVCLLNTSAEPTVIQDGQKIAQMIIQPIITPHIEVVSDLPAAEDDRGEGGFGSTGIK